AFEPCHSEEPQLQDVKNRIIRCHLYPEIKQLPPLEKNKMIWNPVSEQDQTLFTVTDLSVHFEQKKGIFSPKKDIFKAVDGLTFRLQRGKTLALVGESGCGKTTASRALLRLLPVSGGVLIYRDQNILSLGGKALRQYRKKVQLIFQD